MAFSIARLLIHSEAVPPDARAALRVALDATPDQTGAQLETAARLLYRGTGVDCGDARELVGLEPGGSCA